MIVRQILLFPSGNSFPICPACEITLEREYQKYCDRCGQCLDWKRFDKAVIVLWTGKQGRTIVHRSNERIQ